MKILDTVIQTVDILMDCLPILCIMVAVMVMEMEDLILLTQVVALPIVTKLTFKLAKLTLETQLVEIMVKKLDLQIWQLFGS